MKTKEEFKALIYEKERAYKEKQRTKQKRLVMIFASTAACVVVLCSTILPQFMGRQMQTANTMDAAARRTISTTATELETFIVMDAAGNTANEEMVATEKITRITNCKGVDNIKGENQSTIRVVWKDKNWIYTDLEKIKKIRGIIESSKAEQTITVTKISSSSDTNLSSSRGSPAYEPVTVFIFDGVKTTQYIIEENRYIKMPDGSRRRIPDDIDFMKTIQEMKP